MFSECQQCARRVVAAESPARVPAEHSRRVPRAHSCATHQLRPSGGGSAGHCRAGAPLPSARPTTSAADPLIECPPPGMTLSGRAFGQGRLPGAVLPAGSGPSLICFHPSGKTTRQHCPRPPALTHTHTRSHVFLSKEVVAVPGRSLIWQTV